MKEIKRGLVRIFFALEIVGFAFMYVFGAQGLQVLVQLKKENSVLEGEIGQLHAEVAGLEQQIIDWKDNSFAKEKLAREQLQMARTEDEVYYIQ